MKVADFINQFKTGRLGKKRQHTGYKVMEGNHCQLLVRSTRSRGIPGGSELIGIYFGNDICIFHNNFNMLRDNVIDHVTNPKPVINSKILKENDDSLIESGIIEFDDAKGLMLLEIGSTPWLFENDPEYTPNKYSGFSWKYNTGTQVSKRYETIAEAVKDVALDDGVISSLGRLLKVMPSDFKPVTTSEADIKVLMSPPNPFDYGLTLEDCIVQKMYTTGGRGCVPLYVKENVIVTSRGAGFKAACIAYNVATKRFGDVEPNNWNNLTTEVNGTILIGEDDQVYFKGHVRYRYSAVESANFQTWCQVVGETDKIRLPVR
jgi:hypothetical protein